MYFGKLAHIIEQHATHSGCVKFYRTRFGPEDVVSIVDFSLPRRKGVTATGYSEEDWFRDSMVCNCSWLNGHIPEHGDDGVMQEFTAANPAAAWERRPSRGYKGTIKLLLGDGSILPGEELDALLGEDSRKYATNESRYRYIHAI